MSVNSLSVSNHRLRKLALTLMNDVQRQPLHDFIVQVDLVVVLEVIYIQLSLVVVVVVHSLLVELGWRIF